MKTNNKYKTVLCNSYQQGLPCAMGHKCHFAHGPMELRKQTDPLPNSLPVMGEKSKPVKSNYKTVICQFFLKGQCKHGVNCSYAHGEEELMYYKQGQQPQLQMDNSLFNPNAYHHQNQTFVIVAQQLQFLIDKLQQLYPGQEIVNQKLQNASRLLHTGDQLHSADILNNILLDQSLKGNQQHQNILNKAMQVGYPLGQVPQNPQNMYQQLIGYKQPQLFIPNNYQRLPPRQNQQFNNEINEQNFFNIPDQSQFFNNRQAKQLEKNFQVILIQLKLIFFVLQRESSSESKSSSF